jgi:peptide/nickel transport system substrate-binding protein
MSRHKVLAIFAVVMMMAVLAACDSGSTPAPSATTAVQPPAGAASTTAAPSGLKPVPRNQTVNLGWSVASPVGVTNPWAIPGYTHQEGNVFMWEALSYYGIFGSKEIPWLADSMTYNADFTQLTIKLNPMAAWSDGSKLTSKDVLFTFNGQNSNDKLPYHADFQQFMKDASAPDDTTVILNFKTPAPRFKYEVLTFKFDTGIPIVPAAVLSAQADVTAFQGGLNMPHSGPYNLVVWDQNQKIYDLRDDWWAVKAGKHAAPAAKRIVMVNIGGQVGQNMDIVVQREVNNEFDAILDVRASVAKSLLDANKKITSHTASASPYGYLDWWPNSLWMNDQLAPYSDPNVRKAICETVDRDTINKVVYDGAQIATIYPFPLYPNLQKFADSAAVKAQQAQYNPGKFDLADSAKLMTAAGFAKDSSGLWAKGGQTVNATIQGFQGIHSDIAPVLVEMLKKGGFDGNVNFGSDSGQNMADGKAGLYLFGHGASTVDPYAALNLFHSKYSAAIGTTAGNSRFSRYKNPEFDALLDQMAPLSADDPKFQALAAQAIGIYWRDTIDCPVIQWLHRIPYNQTYWTNWPTAANPADGENGAFWAETGMLVITGLKPSGQ